MKDKQTNTSTDPQKEYYSNIPKDWRSKVNLFNTRPELFKRKNNNARSGASLEPYKGAWGLDQAKHLLNRTLVGYTPKELDDTISMGMEMAVSKLLTIKGVDDVPITYVKNISDELGKTWIDKGRIRDGDVNWKRLESLGAWWTGRMMGDHFSFVHKMTLFLANLYVVKRVDALSAIPYYEHVSNLYDEAFGNVKTLVEKTTINRAMLVFLNGTQNTLQNPNENYARELFELFTIGKGPQIGPGDYTFYTEKDVKAAAKVLTGWDVKWPTDFLSFKSNEHDKSDKEFSDKFNSKVIKNNNEKEYLDLIDMIFSKRQTAKYWVQQFMLFFMHPDVVIDHNDDIIEPLADLLFESNFEVLPVLNKFFRSDFFYSQSNQGLVIKSSVDFLCGMLKNVGFVDPQLSASFQNYDRAEVYQKINLFVRQLEQDIMSPPVVAGWPAYFLAPSFHRQWISATTIPRRKDITSWFLNPTDRPFNLNLKSFVDPIAFAELSEDPSDISKLLEHYIKVLLPSDITINIPPDDDNFKGDVPEEYQNFWLFKEQLIPGLPSFEWSVEWNKYKSNPNASNTVRLRRRLLNLMLLMINLAEYQLS